MMFFKSLAKAFNNNFVKMDVWIDSILFTSSIWTIKESQFP